MNEHLKNIGKSVSEAAKAGAQVVVKTMAEYPRTTFAAGVIGGAVGVATVLKLKKRKAKKAHNPLRVAC